MPNHDKLSLHQQHVQKVYQKHEKLKGLVSLLETWEKLDDGNDPEVHQYVIELRAKVRNARNQILVMKVISDRDMEKNSL